MKKDKELKYCMEQSVAGYCGLKPTTSATQTVRFQ